MKRLERKFEEIYIRRGEVESPMNETNNFFNKLWLKMMGTSDCIN